MAFENLKTGAVIRYSYLWSWQSERGETQGRKARPAAVGVRVRGERGPDEVVLFPITSQPPQEGRFAVEIPHAEKERAGLEAFRKLWIVLDDYNADLVGQSWYLTPEAPMGYFSAAFFLPVVKEFIKRRDEAQGFNRRN